METSDDENPMWERVLLIILGCLVSVVICMYGFVWMAKQNVKLNPSSTTTSLTIEERR